MKFWGWLLVFLSPTSSSYQNYWIYLCKSSTHYFSFILYLNSCKFYLPPSLNSLLNTDLLLFNPLHTYLEHHPEIWPQPWTLVVFPYLNNKDYLAFKGAFSWGLFPTLLLIFAIILLSTSMQYPKLFHMSIQYRVLCAYAILPHNLTMFFPLTQLYQILIIFHDQTYIPTMLNVFFKHPSSCLPQTESNLLLGKPFYLDFFYGTYFYIVLWLLLHVTNLLISKACWMSFIVFLSIL